MVWLKYVAWINDPDPAYMLLTHGPGYVLYQIVQVAKIDSTDPRDTYSLRRSVTPFEVLDNAGQKFVIGQGWW